MPLRGRGVEVEGRHPDRLEHHEDDVEGPARQLVERRRGLSRAGGERDRPDRARDVVETGAQRGGDAGEAVPDEPAADVVGEGGAAQRSDRERVVVLV